MKADACVHHWEIATANGPVSVGTCKNCKETKEFNNSMFVDMHHITLERDTNATLEQEEESRRRWNWWAR